MSCCNVLLWGQPKCRPLSLWWGVKPHTWPVLREYVLYDQTRCTLWTLWKQEAKKAEFRTYCMWWHLSYGSVKGHLQKTIQLKKKYFYAFWPFFLFSHSFSTDQGDNRSLGFVGPSVNISPASWFSVFHILPLVGLTLDHVGLIQNVESASGRRLKRALWHVIHQ